MWIFAKMVNAYADFLFNTGLLDERQRDYCAAQTKIISHLIEQKHFEKAFQVSMPQNDYYVKM